MISFEQRVVQLGENTAKALRKLYPLPHSEADFIAEALDKHTKGDLQIKIFSESELAVVKWLVDELRIPSQDPAILEIINPARKIVVDAMNAAGLVEDLEYSSGSFVLKSQYVAQFKNAYLASIQQKVGGIQCSPLPQAGEG